MEELKEVCDVPKQTMVVTDKLHQCLPSGFLWMSVTHVVFDRSKFMPE